MTARNLSISRPSRSRTPISSARLPERLTFQWEELWLRLLPHLMRDYAWAAVDGFRMFGSSGHQRYLSRLKRGRAEPYTVELFREHVRPGMVVVDVGAYLGYYALLGAHGAGETGMVYAYECDPVNHRFLLHNLRLNGFGQKVVSSSAAVADRPGSLPFFVSGGDLSTGSLSQERRRRAVNVTSTTLDHELGGRGLMSSRWTSKGVNRARSMA